MVPSKLYTTSLSAAHICRITQRPVTNSTTLHNPPILMTACLVPIDLAEQWTSEIQVSGRNRPEELGSIWQGNQPSSIADLVRHEWDGVNEFNTGVATVDPLPAAESQLMESEMDARYFLPY